MAITFLEFCGLLVIFLAVTQIIIPLFAPSAFDFFWLFRKNKEPGDENTNAGDNLRNLVKEAVGLKKSTEKTINKVREKTKKNLENAKELNEQLKDESQ
jgi:hypothetical protein